MSFSSITKKELCNIKSTDTEYNKAELMGLFGSCLTGTTFSLNTPIYLKVENSVVAKRIYTLLKQEYNINVTININKSKQFREHHIYEIQIRDIECIGFIFRDINKFCDGHYQLKEVPEVIINNRRIQTAYIRGFFLGAGSISNPEKTYHLEMIDDNKEYMMQINDMLLKYDIKSRVIQRKKNYLLYLKEGESIVNFLNLIGAHQALLSMENTRIVKEMKNKVNRIVNCETANINKIAQASREQIQDIMLIEEKIGLKKISPTLSEIAQLRLENPETSLKDLGEMLNPPVGKSGVYHRFKKIHKLAEDL
jgi:hypothetical protein